MLDRLTIIEAMETRFAGADLASIHKLHAEALDGIFYGGGIEAINELKDLIMDNLPPVLYIDEDYDIILEEDYSEFYEDCGERIFHFDVAKTICHKVSRYF